MKKNFLAAIAATVMLLAGCQEQQKIKNESTNTPCGSVHFYGSAERMELAKVFFALLTKQHKEDPKSQAISATYTVADTTVRSLPGFFVNSVGIQYSDKILQKTETLFGSNASLSSRCQMAELDQLLCQTQLAQLQAEYSRVLAACAVDTLVLPPVVEPATSPSHWAFAPWLANLLKWLGKAALAILAVFLLLLLIWLLWRLLSSLIEGFSSFDDNNDETPAGGGVAVAACSNIALIEAVEKAAGKNGKACFEKSGDLVKVCVDHTNTDSKPLTKEDIRVAVQEALPGCSGGTVNLIINSLGDCIKQEDLEELISKLKS